MLERVHAEEDEEEAFRLADQASEELLRARIRAAGFSSSSSSSSSSSDSVAEEEATPSPPGTPMFSSMAGSDADVVREAFGSDEEPPRAAEEDSSDDGMSDVTIMMTSDDFAAGAGAYGYVAGEMDAEDSEDEEDEDEGTTLADLEAEADAVDQEIARVLAPQSSAWIEAYVRDATETGRLPLPPNTVNAARHLRCLRDLERSVKRLARDVSRAASARAREAAAKKLRAQRRVLNEQVELRLAEVHTPIDASRFRSTMRDLLARRLAARARVHKAASLRALLRGGGEQ